MLTTTPIKWEHNPVAALAHLWCWLTLDIETDAEMASLGHSKR